MKYLPLFLSLFCVALTTASRGAEVCTTQSQMKPADRDALSSAAAALALKIQANDTAGVRSLTIADFRDNFSGMSSAIASTAPKLAGAQTEVEQIYVLDASTLTKTSSGGNPDAQFFCTLNQSTNEAEFAIPQLPPGKYAFAMVRMAAASPWRLSFLLRQDSGNWLLAGLYPKRLAAGAHDGLWYWEQARALSSGATREPWNAWLYFQEAHTLLLPAPFVSSTNLDKLQTELNAAVPSAISGGLSSDTPLVLKGLDGSEFRFTSLTADSALSGDQVDVIAHIKVDSLGDGTIARKRNVDAIAALVTSHPELRKAFHGVWLFAEAPGQSPYATELAMADIR